VGWFPSLYPVCHIARRYDAVEVDPDTGNEIQVVAAPVVRYAQEFSQVRKGSSSDVLSADFVDRVEETIEMSVDDVSVYATADQVILNPEISGGEYVAGTGTAYWIDGTPNDQKNSPWPGLFAEFGGVIRLKRVT